MSDTTERILCSATWYKDFPCAIIQVANVTHGVVLCGHRHGHIIHQMLSLTGKRSAEVGKYIQGFLKNKNRFVDRKDAAKIAYAAKQVNHRVSWQDVDWERRQLYSEDLY